MMPHNAEGSAWQREEADAAGVRMRIEEGRALPCCLYAAR
jgi:hypothetical protein